MKTIRNRKLITMNTIVFKTASSLYPNIIYSWLIRTIVMFTIFLYSIFELPLYLGVPYILIAFYLIFVKFFQYKLYRFIYEIEFDDDNQIITFYYRANIFGKGKYSLPYSGLKLIFRKTIISKSVFIKDMRKGKKGVFVGVVNNEYYFGGKYWNKELWKLVVEELKQIAKQNDKGISYSIAP